MANIINFKGRKFKVSKSPKDDKQLLSKSIDGKKPKLKVHFGDPDMKEYPGTKRGDNYCARSYGIGEKYNILGDPKSANTWSRLYLWNCKKKKSMDKRTMGKK